MEVYIVDSPQKGVLSQGVWVHYKASEYHIARQTIEAHVEMYASVDVDTKPLEHILEELSFREHPQ